MKKKATDDLCTNELQAAAATLTKAAASTSDIVTAFIDVAISLAERDPAYAPAELDIVANLFSAGEGVARMRLKALTAPKRPRKKS